MFLGDLHSPDLCKACYFDSRSPWHFRHSLTDDMAGLIAVSLVEYCNSLLFGVTSFNLDKIQRVWNLAAAHSGTTNKENQLCSDANCSNTHNIIPLMAPHECNVILRTTTDEFIVIHGPTIGGSQDLSPASSCWTFHFYHVVDQSHAGIIFI